MLKLMMSEKIFVIFVHYIYSNVFMRESSFFFLNWKLPKWKQQIDNEYLFVGNNVFFLLVFYFVFFFFIQISRLDKMSTCAAFSTCRIQYIPDNRNRDEENYSDRSTLELRSYNDSVGEFSIRALDIENRNNVWKWSFLTKLNKIVYGFFCFFNYFRKYLIFLLLLKIPINALDQQMHLMKYVLNLERIVYG